MTLPINNADHTDKGIDARFQCITEAIEALQSGGALSVARKVLTPTLLKSANASPVTLVSAPGAGMAIIPLAAHWATDVSAATSAYGNVGDLKVYLGNPLTDIWFYGFFNFADGNLTDSAHPQHRWQCGVQSDSVSGLIVALGAAAIGQIENKPLLFATNVNSSGELTDGDFPATVNVIYAVVSL